MIFLKFYFLNNCKDMELDEVLSMPFKLVRFNLFHDPLQVKVKFKTKDIFGETTKEEIFILSKMYLDHIILQYKNYIIEGQSSSESSYKLSVGIIKDDKIKYKHIYSCFYNNVRDRISWENKYDDNFDIEGSFFVCIDVNVMVIPDYSSNDDDDEDIRPVRKTILEKECVICFENKSNMLYLDCFHVCVCNVCDSKGKFKKCPLCRTKIKKQKIRLT